MQRKNEVVGWWVILSSWQVLLMFLNFGQNIQVYYARKLPIIWKLPVWFKCSIISTRSLTKCFSFRNQAKTSFAHALAFATSSSLGLPVICFTMGWLAISSAISSHASPDKFRLSFTTLNKDSTAEPRQPEQTLCSIFLQNQKGRGTIPPLHSYIKVFVIQISIFMFCWG